MNTIKKINLLRDKNQTFPEIKYTKLNITKSKFDLVIFSFVYFISGNVWFCHVTN